MSGVSAFIKGLRLFRSSASRLHLHNLGYYIVLIRKPYPVSPEKVRQACLFASAVNGVKAARGRCSWEAGQMANVPLSEVGMFNWRLLRKKHARLDIL